MFYKLIFNTILHNWKFFFDPQNQIRSQLLLSQFQRCLETFVFSFKQNDLELVKFNLSSLLALNASRKLFSRPVFADAMASPFMKVLLISLISKMYSTLSDEIYKVIYEMASVNFPNFHNKCLVEFLTEATSLNDHQKMLLKNGFSMATDSPTFIFNLSKLVNDFCYFELQNKQV